ncbi:unnamed protein product, partial [Iphiclides podalirius]
MRAAGGGAAIVARCFLSYLPICGRNKLGPLNPRESGLARGAKKLGANADPCPRDGYQKRNPLFLAVLINE